MISCCIRASRKPEAGASALEWKEREALLALIRAWPEIILFGKLVRSISSLIRVLLFSCLCLI